MSARKVITPKSAQAKDANETAKELNSSSAKKLVQTRLPFKLLTPLQKASAIAVEKSTSPSTSSAVELDVEVEQEPRKRKLSYNSDNNHEKHDGEIAKEEEELRRSNSKENMGLGVAPITPSKKPNNDDIVIIQLDNDDDDKVDDDDEEETGEKAEIKPKNVKARKKSPGQKMAHIQIKLPLNSKRAKRRKALINSKLVKQSQQAKERSDSSDDIVSLPPQKRLKIEKKAVECTMDVDLAVIQLDSSKSNSESHEVASSDQDMEIDVDTATLKKSSPEKKEEQIAKEEKSDLDSVSVAKQQTTLTAKQQTTLTAKQQRLMEQRRKAREEKECKLQEERRLKQLEKEQREQQKKVEREQKEEERRKEREQKEEERRKEREEKERKRQAEIEEKRKRNEAKEEMQRKKDEDRRRKEQEREEAELKKKRAAASFTKFFVPKQTKQSSSGNNGSLEHDPNSGDSGPSHKNGSSSQTLAFRPFRVKDDMILAPVIRGTLATDKREQLAKLFYHDDNDDQQDDANESIGRVKRPSRAQLYLSELRHGRHKPQRVKRNARLERCAKEEEEDDDVQVIDDLATAGTPIVEERPKQLPWMRAKYLHFADNRRPPYYGTWRKRSQLISARRPLVQDKSHFDYEVDSDCEWEEDEPGESLSASEDEKERESEEESEEEYNEWFVPHGHLSDEELQNDGDLEDGNTREAQKAKLQVLQLEFAKEMKTQTKKIKPRLLGPVWLDENGNKSQLCPQVFIQTINMYACWQLQPLSLEPPPELELEGDAPEEIKSKPSTLQLDEMMLQQLVRLIHGNSKSKVYLISEYLEYLKTQIEPESQTLLPSKTLLREKFDELASWNLIEVESDAKETKKTKKPKKRLCWVVNASALQKFHLNDLTLQNEWKHLLPPKTATKTADTSLHETTPPNTEMNDAAVTDISKLNTKCEASTTTRTDSHTAAASNNKKRGTLLMSVPRDQQFHTPTKNALISQYLRKQNVESINKKKSPPAAAADGNGHNSDIVLLSD